MKIKVTDRSAYITEDEILVAGSVVEYTVEFEFTDAWEGYTKTAVFKTAAGLIKDVLLGETGSAVIPWETLEEPQYLQIGVYGTKSSQARPTLWVKDKYIEPGAEPYDKATYPESTPWADALAQVESNKASAEAAAEDAEAFAYGKRNGEAVESSDPTYHNNAKYYSERAAASAASAATSVEGAVKYNQALTLTDAQKEQARANIGAAEASALEATQENAIYIEPDQITGAATVSSNASEIINAAITAANANGKHYVVIPAGEYWLTDTIYLKSDVILKGCGMDATTLKIADDCDIDAIRVAGPINNSGIMDLSIDGNRIRNYSVYEAGHHGNAINVWLHYGRIERVRTNWVYKHSLLLNYDTGDSDDGLGFEPEHQNDMGNLNKVLWCDFRDSLLQGVMWGWRTMDSWMCYTNIGSHAANLYLEGGTSRFIGNHFDGDGDNGAGPEYNVYCGDGCKAMVFENNIFENTQKENIYFRRPSYSNETKTISIVNNIIRTCSKKTNNTYANIYISGYSASVPAAQIVISGNQILNPDTNANHGYAGVHLNYCKDVKISGNTYFNVGADNAKVEDTCSNVANDDAASTVRYDTEQSLTDAQKTTARGNIGAAGEAAMQTMQDEVDTHLLQLRRAAVIEKAYVKWGRGVLGTDNNGKPKTDAKSIYTVDYFLVDPGTEIRFTGNLTDRLNTPYFYDINKNLIGTGTNTSPYSIPENAYFIRFAYRFKTASGITVDTYEGGMAQMIADWDVSCVSAIEKAMQGGAASLQSVQPLSSPQSIQALDADGGENE